MRFERVVESLLLLLWILGGGVLDLRIVGVVLEGLDGLGRLRRPGELSKVKMSVVVVDVYLGSDLSK